MKPRRSRKLPALRAIILGVSLLGLASHSEAEFRALIIGINSYHEVDSHFSDLQGVKDAMRFEATLRSVWRRNHPKIKRLWDKDASKRNIIDAIEHWLIRSAGSDDTLVLFFSGHGTTVPADFATGIRSALVPQDVQKKGNGKGLVEGSLITGKYFRDLMALLKDKRVRNFTMIVDACQSGGMRRKNLIPKAILNDAVGVEPGKSGGGGPMFERGESPGEYVVISAAGTTEWAWQGPDGGYLTIALTDAIQNFQHEASAKTRSMTYLDAQDWILNAMDNLSQHGIPQHPFLKGRLNRPMFATGAISNDPYYSVRVEHKPPKLPIIRVGAGTLFGINSATVFEIYPPGTLKFAESKPLCHAKVIKVGDFSCEVKPIDLRRSVNLLAAGRAVIQNDSAARKNLAMSELASSNPRLRLQLEAIPVSTVAKRNTTIEKLGSTISANQWFSFRVRATGHDGKPLFSSDNFVYLQLLGCHEDGRVAPLWPQNAISSEETRLVADGKWRYLGQDGNLLSQYQPRQVSFWRLGSNPIQAEEVFKLVGTSQTVNYEPIVVDYPASTAKSSIANPALYYHATILSSARQDARTQPARSGDISVVTLALQVEKSGLPQKPSIH